MKEIIKNILAELAGIDSFSRLLPRKTGLDLNLNKIQAIIGPRRVGKTSAMLLAMQELRQKQDIPDDQLLYFNFEDDRVQFRTQELDLLLQSWMELYPSSDLKKTWFFFDEVQAAPGWEHFINRINETITKKIIFTGSNSAVLHTEIKSVMRGRSIAKELLPLSFPEYCEFINVKPALYGKGKSKTIHLFHRYLIHGGYPETVSITDETIHTVYLQEYYNTMLLRDIVEYNQLSNYSYLRSLYRHAATTIGKTISIRRLHNQIKSQGYSVALNSLYQVMDMAENAYLFKRISRFDHSILKSENSDKKIYWIDNGLLNAITTKYASNKGQLLENLVFWELYRRYGSIYNNNIYYYKDQTAECDFIIVIKDGVQIPVQVCWSIADVQTHKRELKGLLNACTYCKCNEGWIITAEDEDKLTIEGIEMSVMPAWKWLLSQKNDL